VFTLVSVLCKGANEEGDDDFDSEDETLTDKQARGKGKKRCGKYGEAADGLNPRALIQQLKEVSLMQCPRSIN